MESSLALIILCGVLTSVGIYLVLERSLSRIVLGLACLTNGVNILMLIAGGRSGAPPIVGSAPKEEMADPLVQAMMLTAIVISLGTTAFLMALAYRSWQLNGNDEVQDDLEDKRIARAAERAKIAEREDQSYTVEEDAAQAHDETEGEWEDDELAGTIHPVYDQPRRREDVPPEGLETREGRKPPEQVPPEGLEPADKSETATAPKEDTK